MMAIFDLEIQSGSETINLTDQGYSLISFDNLGMPPITRFNQSSPLQNGVFDVGFKLQPRRFKLEFSYIGNDQEDIYEKRNRLFSFFSPSNTEVLIKFTFSNGEKRHIKAFFIDGFSFPTTTHMFMQEKAVGVFYSPNPLFFDPISENVTFNIAGSASGFSIPMAIPLGIGSSSIDYSQAINYDGNFKTPVTIYIYGSITNPTIENESTGEKLAFIATIGSGDYYIVNTKFGEQSVEDQDGNNVIANLSDDSDLATFHIASNPEVASGLNSIKVSGSSADANTKVVIQFFNRFLELSLKYT